MKRIICAVALIALLAGLFLIRGSHVAIAQQEERDAEIHVSTETRDEALKNRPVMLYLIRDGQVLKSGEAKTDSGPFTPYWGGLPIGVYDVKIEGEGVETLIKKGIIASHKNVTGITFQLTSGQGVHVVEYPTGAVSKDDVATRLATLEAAVAALQK